MPSTTSSAAAIPSNLAPPPEQIDELFARLPLPSGVGSAFLPPSSQPGAIGSGTQTGLGLGLGSVGLSSAGAMGTPASVLGTASGFSAGTLGGLGGLPGHGGAAVLGGNPALAGLGLSNPASALPLAAPNLGLDVGSFGLGLGAGIGGAAGMPMARPQAVVEPPKWVYRDPQGQVQGQCFARTKLLCFLGRLT